MKNLFFIISLLSSVHSFGQFPPEFPKKLLNKVYCGNITVYAKKYMSSEIDFSMNTNFDYKIYISESEGIYVEYNPGQKFGKDKSGKTEIVKSFPLWTKEPDVHKDKFGDVTGKTTSYKFKVYPDTKKDHHIKEISLTIYEDGFKFSNGEIAKEYSRLYLTVNVPYHQDAQLTLSSDEIECERLKTKAEIEKQEQDRIKLENQKKEADKSTLQKINDLISKNSLEDAAKEYSKLNFVNSEMKGILQQKLEDKFGQELDQLNTYNVDNYIKNNKSKINAINPGVYLINFDKKGNSSNVSFPAWSSVPKKEIASFSVKLNSETEINIVLKDSILVSSTYSTSNTKPLFIDKNEIFYFKTKTGLPVAKISIDPSIDKKLIRINKVYKREKYANGILIDTQEFKTEKTVGIMKKDQ
jgi:hypothetical protein